MPEGAQNPTLLVRSAHPGDAGSIATTLREAFAEFEAQYTPEGFAATTPSAAQIATRFDEGPVWVAESGGLVVGTGAAVRRGDALYIRSMAVHPGARGQRIGARLLETIEAFAVATGHRRLVLSTTPFLEAAIALYQRAGFQPTGGRSDLHGTPLLEMDKSLTAVPRVQLRLRRTTLDDLSFVISAERDEGTSRFVNVWPEDRHRAALGDEDLEHLIVESLPDDRRIGFVILAGLKDVNRSVEFRRIVITETNRGYGRAAVRAITGHVFTDLSAHRLWLDVKEPNARARAVYAKEGFRYEGTFRECLLGPAGFESLVVMSMLEQEYHGG